ncbi:hypothetical protein [Marinovum sp. 1_MG-2023]|uniref:hypothetical protein n=1 Tax=Marinovum sp. 1_MG-2023 TaxID=3062633 RepID=UPI003FA5893B
MRNFRDMVLALGAGTLVLAATQVQAQTQVQSQAQIQVQNSQSQNQLEVQGQRPVGQNCAPRPKVIARLAEKYGETRQSIGLGSQNAVVEVFASQETGSWTIIVTMANGVTCLLASGQAFETLAETLPVAGKDA